jgi:hypothetical protein
MPGPLIEPRRATHQSGTTSSSYCATSVLSPQARVGCGTGAAQAVELVLSQHVAVGEHSGGVETATIPLGRQLLIWWHCLELLLAGEFFHVVQGLQGNDPAIFLIEL